MRLLLFKTEGLPAHFDGIAEHVPFRRERMRKVGHVLAEQAHDVHEFCV